MLNNLMIYVGAKAFVHLYFKLLCTFLALCILNYLCCKCFC